MVRPPVHGSQDGLANLALTRSTPAGAARAWSSGARRVPPTRLVATGARTTGRDRSTASAIPARGWRSSAWRPPPTAPTGPAACSPATARATGSTLRCTVPATPTSRPPSERGDGLRLSGAYVTAVVRCAPPANRPAPHERDNCLPYLERELGCSSAAARSSPSAASPGTGAAGNPRTWRRGPAPEAALRPRRRGAGGRWTLLGCYHPSQQNTFTGRLTEPMLDACSPVRAELTRS